MIRWLLSLIGFELVRVEKTCPLCQANLAQDGVILKVARGDSGVYDLNICECCARLLDVAAVGPGDMAEVKKMRVDNGRA